MLLSSSRSQSKLQKEEIEEALIREIEESLRDGAEPGTEGPTSDQPENLPSKPLHFVLHYLKYYRWPLLTIVLLELGQAVCQILIPKAVQGIIDSAVPLQGQPQVSIWTALSGPMKFFVILNIGILLFSRCSAKQFVQVSAGALAAIFHGELCRLAFQPRRGSLDGSESFAVDSCL
jgi:hypothetical protein